MTHFIILDKEDIEKIDNDRFVILEEKNNERTVICSEVAYKEYMEFWGLEE